MSESDFLTAKDILSELFDMIDMKNSPEFFVRCILIDTLTLIVNTMNKSSVKFDRFSSLYFETLYLCRSSQYNETKQRIITNINKIMDIFADEIANLSIQISQVKEFIKENCMSSSFSVAVLADSFKVSIAYMSYIFKKKTAMNLSYYVWQLCLDKAQNLLRNTSMSISEINVSVGYKNSSSLRRKFNKETNITPSQYRNKWKS